MKKKTNKYRFLAISIVEGQFELLAILLRVKIWYIILFQKKKLDLKH